MILISEISTHTQREQSIRKSRDKLRVCSLISELIKKKREVDFALLDAQLEYDYLHHTGVFAFMTEQRAKLIYKFFI